MRREEGWILILEFHRFKRRSLGHLKIEYKIIILPTHIEQAKEHPLQVRVQHEAANMGFFFMKDFICT